MKAKPSELKRLGIDEIALIKGKGNYCAVLIDLEKSNLIGILAGRKQEEIREVLLEWGLEVLEQIEEVSIDLWKGYRNVVRDLMLNAQVGSDRFHVMAQINKELDAQRKREKRQVENLIKKAESSQKKADQEKVLEGLKKSKYVLLKNQSDLHEEQKAKLVQLKDVSPTLKSRHELKE